MLETPLGHDEEANIRGVELPHPHAPAPDCESINGNSMLVHPDDIDEEDFAPEIKVNFYFAILLLSVMTALGGVTAEWLVDSIDGLTEAGGISREFVGLILLPGKHHVFSTPLCHTSKPSLLLSLQFRPLPPLPSPASPPYRARLYH